MVRRMHRRIPAPISYVLRWLCRSTSISAISSPLRRHCAELALAPTCSTVEAPALIVTGWYDNLVHEGFKLFHGWSTRARSPEARRQTKLLVGPWSHRLAGELAHGSIELGSQGVMDIVEEHLRWYDRRLKGIDNGMDDEPPVHIFVMGANVWRQEAEWPLTSTRYTNYYLHSGGRANSIGGDGALDLTAPENEPSDNYSYDPNDPVPTVGGQFMKSNPDKQPTAGPWDRRSVERRDDVEVTGPVSLTLYASSSAPDTDFTGTLIDVRPDGRAIIITEGLLRARFRESIEHPTLMEPGKVYELTIKIWETSNAFKEGHRIRLEASSSNFPRFDRNLNTGHQPGMDAEMRIADQTIYHDGRRPSHLTLPVIPDDGA